jgi:hypothetical protein
LRLFAPEMGVGIWWVGVLYLNDTHELDLKWVMEEKKYWNELEAEPDDLIVYMTSQKIHPIL